MKTIKFLMVFLFMTAFSFISKADELRYWAYCDIDGDGHACPQKMKEIPADKVFYYLNEGWLVSNHKPAIDCDDANDMLFHNKKLWIDNDGDKYVTTYQMVCMGTAVPAGYIDIADRLGYDCDDANPAIWQNMGLYFDGDADGHVTGAPVTYCVGLPATYPANYIDKATVKGYADCNDADPLVYRNVCLTPIAPPGIETISVPVKGNVEMCIGDAIPAGYVRCDGKPAVADLSYSVYPNPVNDRLNITPNENWNSRVEIRLVDQFGRVARVVNNPSAAKGQVISVNTGDLKPGIYNLTITSGEMMATKQIGVKL
jgi:hypothetical protein